MATLSTSYQRLGQAYVGSSGGSLYVRIYAKYSEQDIANNRTKVQYQARTYYENGTYIYDMQGNGSVSGTGASTQTGSATRPTTGEQVIATTEGWVTHNNDGNKNISCSATLNFPNWGWSKTANGSASLPTIPRASGISCSSPNIGDTAIITLDRKNASFTNTVTYKIGTITGTIATKTSQTVLSLSTSDMIEQIYNQIPNAKYIQASVTCTTYNGNTQIGSPQTSNFRLYALEDDVKPTISGTVIDTNTKTIEITQDSNKLIKYASKPKITITATPKYNATIKSYSINLNDGQIVDSQEHTFETIGSDNISINAIDSRGYGNLTNIDLSDRMIDYIKLHIDNINLIRPEDTSTEIILNANGVWFNNNFNETKTNVLTVKFQYRKSSETTWIDGDIITPTISDNTFKFENYSLGELFDFQEEYQIKIIVEDLLMTVGDLSSDIITVPRGQEVVAIGDDGGWMYGDWYLNDKKIKNEEYFEKIIESNTSSVEIDYNFEKNSVYEIYGTCECTGTSTLTLKFNPTITYYYIPGIGNSNGNVSGSNMNGNFEHMTVGVIKGKILFKVELITLDTTLHNIKIEAFAHNGTDRYVYIAGGYFVSSSSDNLTKIIFGFADPIKAGSIIRIYKK